jgi:hypothetical protein
VSQVANILNLNVRHRLLQRHSDQPTARNCIHAGQTKQRFIFNQMAAKRVSAASECKVMNGQKFKVEEPRDETYCAAREI